MAAQCGSEGKVHGSEVVVGGHAKGGSRCAAHVTADRVMMGGDGGM